MPDDPYRLPRHVRPTSYRIVLEPDLETCTFVVQTSIDAEVVEETDRIVLNAIDLEISAATVTDAAGQVQSAAIELDPDTERLHLRLATAVLGSVVIDIAARGSLDDRLRGFYRSQFTDADGVARVIAATQLQATDARRVFPCWDEPDRKATFQITVVAADGLTVVSNAPESARRTRPDGRVEVHFAPTMVMSTYLVAVVVGPLEITVVPSATTTPIRVVHIPGKGGLTQFSGRCAAAALEFFEDYYGIAHPGAKLDLVALPDFAMGAMENLGCVTFRENLLLVDPAVATTDELRTCADVISHEIAHMWFGDLVTMRWWNGIWLNEAFATFMEVLAVDHWQPDWRRWLQFCTERGMAFDVDALGASRPVEVTVRSPEDASAMFDVLTYQKGGALLRMLEQYLGADRFRDGVREYLQRHSYDNTETSDLWDAIESTTGEPVRRVMDSWIFQPGHPLVQARIDGGDLLLDQQRFSFDTTLDDPARWAIPIAVRELGPTGPVEHRVLLDGDSARLALTDPRSAVVVNAGGYGFYRTRLDPAMRSRLLGSTLGHLVALERYALMDDLWASVVAGTDDVADYLAAARSFADETELAVWQTIVTGLTWCSRFTDSATSEGFSAYVRALCGPALARLGFEAHDGEPALDRQLRGLLWRTVVVLGGDHAHVERARRILDEAGHDPGLTAAATTIVASTGTVDDHALFVERFRTAPTPQEQLRYLYALAEFRDAPSLQATMALVDEGGVRTQNSPFLLARAIVNPITGADAWRHVRQRWDQLTTSLPPNTVIRMLEGLRSLTDPASAADVSAFFAERSMGGDDQRLAQILERQQVNVALHARSGAPLADLFA